MDLDSIISLERFSSLPRLIRVTAYVLRFVSNLKRKKANNELTDGEIKQEEVQRAKELWYKEVQRSVFEDEKFDQVKCSLSLFMDEKGILRCRGRLENAPIPFDARYPILLPRCSRFTHLVINECHLKVLHNGVRDTLKELRSKFWVTKGRQTVKNVIGKCSVCKKIEGRSYAVPPPPPLPEFRLSDEFAFTRVGVDFAGPVFVKDVFSKKGEMNKAYITLFTCATCRAVHLEQNFVNIIGILREHIRSVKFKWETSCAYTSTRSQDNYGAWERLNAYSRTRWSRWKCGGKSEIS